MSSGGILQLHILILDSMQARKVLCVAFAAFLVIGLLASAQVHNSSSEVGDVTDGHNCSHTWFFWNKTSQECECGPTLGRRIKCNQAKKEVRLFLISCMTYDNTTSSIAIGYCPYSHLHRLGFESSYTLLPHSLSQLNEAVCG